MDFTYDTSGTARQVAWAQQAVAACTYPLDAIGASVTVVWGALPANTDSTHPYMVTTVDESSAFTIHITPDADNPKAPINQGLSDPATQVQGFYMESVIHELGHVVTYSTFDPAGDDSNTGPITQMCALFWHAETGVVDGRRYGTFDDWDAPSLSWSDEIREGVAEAFKVGFNSGPRVFWNRSHWNIDADNWVAYLALIAPPGGFTSGRLALRIDGYTDPNPDGGGGTEAPIMVVTVAALSGISEVGADLIMVPGGNSGLASFGPGQTIIYDPDISSGPSAFIGVVSFDESGVNSNALNMSMPDFPCWLTLDFDASSITTGMWSTDPADGGAPEFSTATTWVGGYTATGMLPSLLFETAVISESPDDVSPSITVGEWAWPGQTNALSGSRIDATLAFSSEGVPVISDGVLTIPSEDTQNIGETLWEYVGAGTASLSDPYPFIRILGSIQTAQGILRGALANVVARAGRIGSRSTELETQVAIGNQSPTERGSATIGPGLRGARQH